VRSNQYLPQVREQYEALPYPPRDPAEEKTRLVRTWLDDLAMINHYCFAGKQSFRDRFRVLVAGGGTGDSTIFLAEQLRDTDAEIVHLDISRAAIDLARRRAAARGLGNISWVNESLLALPDLGLGKFDYVNCLGVLHHLADPDAGLRSLRAVLNQSGALGLMVYAQYGRTGVYQMQALLRKINEGAPDLQTRLKNAREVLDAAPPTNWFLRAEELFNDHTTLGDAGIYDLLLHSHDRAYTVRELYEWIEDREGMHVELTYPGRGRSAYLPEMVVAPRQPGFLAPLASLPPRTRHEIAELLSGCVIMHTFYATASPAASAPYGRVDYVPCLCNGLTSERLAASIRQHGGKPYMVMDPQTQIGGDLDPGRFGDQVVELIDGRRNFGEIFALVRQRTSARASPPDDRELFSDFRPLFDFLRSIDRLLLRHGLVECPPSAAGETDRPASDAR
jgi:ubiquinone/menaquinone biosynthesis C-methylase UbiE